MKRFLSAVLLLAAYVCLQAAPPSLKSVMVDTNGLVVAPTNFWLFQTNSSSFSNAVATIVEASAVGPTAVTNTAYGEALKATNGLYGVLAPEIAAKADTNATWLLLSITDRGNLPDWALLGTNILADVGQVTDAELAAATNGHALLVDVQASTNGLAKLTDLSAATNGHALLTDLAAATNGLAKLTDVNASTNGVARLADVNAATNWLVRGVTASGSAVASTNNGVVNIAVSDAGGDVTTAQLQSATNLISQADRAYADSATNQLASAVATTYATQAGLASATNNMAKVADVNSSTNLISVADRAYTDTQKQNATNGLWSATDSRVTGATNGLWSATDSRVSGSTNGLWSAVLGLNPLTNGHSASITISNNLIVYGNITNYGILHTESTNDTTSVVNLVASGTITGDLSGATNLPSTSITGVIPMANLATGSYTGTQFVKGDGTLADPPTSGGTSSVTWDSSNLILTLTDVVLSSLTWDTDNLIFTATY